MERDQELLKLINVLRRTGRMASQAHWTGEDKDAAAFCANKYNRVLARLKDDAIGQCIERVPRNLPRFEQAEHDAHDVPRNSFSHIHRRSSDCRWAVEMARS